MIRWNPRQEQQGAFGNLYQSRYRKGALKNQQNVPACVAQKNALSDSGFSIVFDSFASPIPSICDLGSPCAECAPCSLSPLGPPPSPWNDKQNLRRDVSTRIALVYQLIKYIVVMHRGGRYGIVANLFVPHIN